MPQIIHADWDINKHPTGRFHTDLETGRKSPIIGVTFQNGLNDIEPDGSFVPCDMGLDDVADGVTTHMVRRGRYRELRFTDIASTNKHLCKYKDKDGNGQSIKCIDDDCNLPDVSNGKPKFTSSNGITIEHTPTYNGVKIEIVISDPAMAPLEYTFSIKDYGQAYEFTESNGALIATGVNGKKIIYQAPYIVDANEEVGMAHYVLMGRSGGYYQFKKVVDDEAWFRNAVAPVRFDPNIIVDDDSGTFEDTQTYSGAPDNNYGIWAQGALYSQSGNRQSCFIKVDLTSLSGFTVTDAYFGFDVFGSAHPEVGNAHVILVPWGEGNKNGTAASVGELTYNSSAHPTAWNTANCKGDGVDRLAAIDGTYTFIANNSDTHFPVSNAAVQGMIDTPATNYGWVFETLALFGGSVIWRSSETVIGNKPYLYVEFTEGGIAPVHRGMAGGFNQLTGGMQ